MTKPSAFAMAFPLSFPWAITFRPLGESLGVAGAGAATVPAASRGHWVWAGVVLGPLPLLVLAGALVVRRRRLSRDAFSTTEAPN